MHQPPTTNLRTGMLAGLRALAPYRSLHLAEALVIAERQAQRFLERSNIGSYPVHTDTVAGLPHITVQHDPRLETSGGSGFHTWDTTRATWVIYLNPIEPITRQRFSLFHEFKHIIDRGRPDIAPEHTTRREPRELVADYFAGCVLIPSHWLKQAFYTGIQQPHELAARFGVSPEAIRVRLHQCNLTPPLHTEQRTPTNFQTPAQHYLEPAR